MKDKHGYVSFKQKGYHPIYKTGVELQARMVDRDGVPELQLEFEIWTLKGEYGKERMFREVGSVCLNGEELAEFIDMVEAGKEDHLQYSERKQ